MKEMSNNCEIEKKKNEISLLQSTLSEKIRKNKEIGSEIENYQRLCDRKDIEIADLKQTLL